MAAILEKTYFFSRALQLNELEMFNQIYTKCGCLSAHFYFYLFSVCSTNNYGRFYKPSAFGDVVLFT